MIEDIEINKEESISVELTAQASSFELDQTPNNSVDKIFQLILENKYEILRPDIKVTKIEPLNKIEYIQRKKYDIPLEIQQIWPKISAIFLNLINRKEVRFEFKNHPNFIAFKKLCHLYSITPIFSEHNTTVSDGAIITNSVVTLQSAEDMPYFLAHLYNIYKKFSKEAADLIWEVLKDVAEESMNELILNWKEKIYRDLTSWKDYTLEKEECKKWRLPDDCKAAKKYDNLSDQEQGEFLKGVISYHVEIVSTGLLAYVGTNDPKFIKKAFSSANKTIAYIEAFHADKLNITAQVNRETEKILVNAFEPGFFEKALNVLEDSSKSIKVRTTTVGAILSISKKYGYSVPFIGQILLGIDVSKMMLGALFEKEQFFSDKNIASKEAELDLTEIASTFSNIFTLCNYEKVVNLRSDSQKLLIDFKGRFLYDIIQSKKCINVVDADCALSFLSDAEFIKKVVSNNFKDTNVLHYNDDTSISINDFVVSFDLEYCYDSLKASLVGVNQESINNDLMIDA